MERSLFRERRRATSAQRHKFRMSISRAARSGSFRYSRYLHLGDKPFVVLSRAVDRDWPQGAFGRDLRKQWYAHHEALAHLSSRGVHRVIEHSGHDIQLDEPQTVIVETLLLIALPQDLGTRFGRMTVEVWIIDCSVCSGEEQPRSRVTRSTEVKIGPCEPLTDMVFPTSRAAPSL